MGREILKNKVDEINKKIQELKKELGDQPILMCDKWNNNDILQMTSGSFTNKNLFRPTIAFTLNGVVLMELDTQDDGQHDEYEYGAYELSPTEFPLNETWFNVWDEESKTPAMVVAINEISAKRKVAKIFRKKYENLQILDKQTIRKKMKKNDNN